ncbi:MAG: aminotransferase class V-fold PLP-dependent enzyme [Anaerolineales bacterium]|nr:aminotransferase class V-fold PLP-dependent enzyme [Anaerolineales bacterium]
MKTKFLLDPNITFLNHGSFGAVPREVFAVYQQWQRTLENQPVRLLGRKLPSELRAVKSALGSVLNANPENLLLISNVTFGLNLAARSLNLQSGDEILTTTHEYGACLNTLKYLAHKSGARLVQQPVSMPLKSPEDVIEEIWSGVSPKTRLLFLSHITSPTASRFPVAQLCRRANRAGILSIIDGAHAPGQLEIDLAEINADIYMGNCHKWMLSPRGAGFLYAGSAVQAILEPLVVSWGWNVDTPATPEMGLLENLQWTGTYDPSAFLSIPAAIDFQRKHNWINVHMSAQETLSRFLHRFSESFNIPIAYTPEADPYIQMAVLLLPPIKDPEKFQNQLWCKYAIEIPCIEWQEHQFLRVSYQVYNTEADLDRLFSAIEDLMPSFLTTSSHTKSGSL